MSKAFGTSPRAKAAKPAPSKSAPRRKFTLGASGPGNENISLPSEETACIPEAAVVTSPVDNAPTGTTPEPANNEPGDPAQPISPAAPARSQNIMDITLNRSTATRKDERLVIFEYADGRAGQVQFLRSAFPETIPSSITMSGEFAERVEKTPKAKLTKEERALLPKPTLAEKVAKAEERAAKLREKLAKAAQPELATV